MALDASAIDEGTMQDRDWYWAFNSLWNKKSPERCRVTIADTVVCSGGEPQQWMFTAKVTATPHLPPPPQNPPPARG
jgi:hypothetical protein